jgi:hypothetical protein
MRRLAFGVAVAALFTVGVQEASATQLLLPQVRSMRACLTTTTPSGRVVKHLTVCGANYTDVLMAVNARRFLYPVAVGVHRATHQPVEACRCKAGVVLQKAQQVATFTRRRFRDWWANPKTPAGRKLKGCLKNAALALGAELGLYLSGRTWDDAEVVAVVGIACGVGSVVDA